MPLIAEPFFVNGKLTADIVACTQEEYKKYMSSEFHDDINSHRVSSKYLEKYLLDNDQEIPVFKEKLAQSAVGKDALIQWVNAPTITILELKDVLHEAGLSYHDFIDAYAKHLKSL